MTLLISYNRIGRKALGDRFVSHRNIAFIFSRKSVANRGIYTDINQSHLPSGRR
jgi:hypothetical protein